MKEKKIALVTGGTSGVGLSIVKALIRENYFVVLMGSNSTKGKRIEEELNSGREMNAAFACVDLSNLASVSEFAEMFVLTHNRIDLLVHAAGTILPKRELTPEGFEKTFAVGYLSVVILTLKLAALLKKTEGARIVNVSAAPKTVLKINLDFDDLSFYKSYNGFRTSLHTVHAKTVLTQILAEKFTSDRIDVNSFHPGMVRSELTRNLPFMMRLLAKAFSPFMSVDSKNGIFVSTSAELKGVSGQLYENKSPVALNFNAAYKEMLWRKTTELLQPFKLELK